MEDFCNEESFWGIVGEIILNRKLASKHSSLIGSTHRPLDIGLDVRCIAFVNDHLDPYIIEELPGGPLV